MKIHLNKCSACGYNFSTVTLFDTHRIGKHPSENKGVSTRRCLSEAEMHEKGWLCYEVAVSVLVEQKRLTTTIWTWFYGGQLEKKQQQSERMKHIFTKRTKDTPV